MLRILSLQRHSFPKRQSICHELGDLKPCSNPLQSLRVSPASRHVARESQCDRLEEEKCLPSLLADTGTALMAAVLLSRLPVYQLH